MEQEQSILFSGYDLGGMQLKNRVVMAPMTRSRAISNIPNELMAQHYAARAAAGLIITEGTSPSPNGLGYSRIPGLYSPAQVAGWKTVTGAVHANGGKIFVQLMHTGRVAHPLNLPEGGEMVGPSAIAAAGQMWTDSRGMQVQPAPKAITTAGVADLIAEYVHSAQAAIEAGFDGVEVHAANGYLPMQFLNIAANQRSDNYGGSYENRNRFVLELCAAIAAAIGKDKLGIRLSPFNKFNDMTPDEHEEAQYLALATGLKDSVTYIHLLTFAMPPGMLEKLHEAYGGAIILNAGYTASRAIADLQAGKGELVSFGNAFISNPDLVWRMQTGAELAKADPATFYTPGPVGYNDYPALQQ